MPAVADKRFAARISRCLIRALAAGEGPPVAGQHQRGWRGGGHSGFPARTATRRTRPGSSSVRMCSTVAAL